jgi:hypothetical protein
MIWVGLTLLAIAVLIAVLIVVSCVRAPEIPWQEGDSW